MASYMKFGNSGNFKLFLRLPIDLKVLVIVFALDGGLGIYGAILKLLVWRPSKHLGQLDMESVKNTLVALGCHEVVSQFLVQTMYSGPVFVSAVLMSRLKKAGWLIWVLICVYYICMYGYVSGADPHTVAVVRFSWIILIMWAIMRYRVFFKSSTTAERIASTG